MNVTLPNGAVINGIPDGTPKEEIMIKAISAGLATEADFAGQPQAEQPKQSGFVPVEPVKRKSFGEKFKEFVQGGEKGKQNVFASPELNELSFRAAKAGLGGLLTGDTEEIQKIIASNYPEAQFGTIEGQMAVRFPSGDYLLNPKGIDPLDVARFGTDVAAFIPAAGVAGTGFKQLAKGALVAGATQGGLQTVEAATGGEFDPQDVVLDAAIQAGGQVAAPVIKAAASKTKEAVSPFIAKVAEKFKGGASEAPYKDISDAITSGKSASVLPKVMADPEVMKAANELGINVNPGVYSTSDIYREMENALKMIPGSKLSANEKETVRQLGQKADDLIMEWTGTLDKSQISQEFSDRALGAVRELEDEASALYGTFADVIPKSLKTTAPETKATIEQYITDLGGFDNLDPQMKRIYSQLTQEGGPTYALLEKMRRDIGSALKGQGPFKDASQNELKQLYGTLSDDTLNVAKLFGLDEEVTAAKELVKKRKAMEETLQGVLGKDLSKALMTELSTGVRGLTVGKIGNVDKIMKAVPDDQKQMVAISALNDVLAGGKQKATDFSLSGYVSTWEALQRNKAASQQLFKHIPDEVMARMDQIYKVSKGLVELNKKDLNNPSGTARAVIGAMDAENGVVKKLFNVGGQMATGAAATSPFDAGVTGAGIGFLNAMRASKTKATQAADEMLSSQAFIDAMQKHINGDSVAANGILNKIKATGTWLAEQPPEVKRAVERQGLIQYLTSREDERNTDQ